MSGFSTAFERALRGMVGAEIYQRGKRYYRDGAVREWRLTAHAVRVFAMRGIVEGSDEYEVVLHFDCAARAFSRADCTCPYELGCKHLVALGLHAHALIAACEESAGLAGNGAAIRDAIVSFAKSYAGDAAFITVDETVTEKRSRLEEELAKIGIPAENLSDAVIEELLAARGVEAKSTAAQKVQMVKVRAGAGRPPAPPLPTPPPLSNYRIRLAHDLSPQIVRFDSPYLHVNSTEMLARTDLTDAARELLNSIKSGVFDGSKIPARDLRRLLTLVTESGIRATRDYYNQKPVRVAEASEKLTAALRHLHEEYYDGKRDSLILEMSGMYWKGHDSYDTHFVAGENVVAHVSPQNITIYTLPTELARIVARVREAWSDDMGSYTRTGPRRVGFRTTLTGEEVWRLDTIMQLAGEHLDLTESLAIHTILRADKADPIFLIDYNAAESTLRAKAAIDYGSLTQDIGASINFSMAGGRRHLALRKYWINDAPTHRIQVEGATLRVAPINEKAEIALYKKVHEEAEEIGFTKTLKCTVEQPKKVREYLRTTLPALAAYAKQEDIPIRFERDKATFESAHVNADFTIDANEANDWLHFDVSLYCNGEKISLEDIITFIESGETVFKHGEKMLEITNRAELERLVAMLRSFQKREEGYEGKLYHAAELQYVLTSSPHYNTERKKSFDAFLKKVHSGKPVKPVRIPARFEKILRPYQKDGVHWLHFLRSYRFAGILADDMGLGKTIQALVLLSMQRVSGEPSLVICPKTLLFNWKNETQHFAPEMRALVYEGTPPERLRLRGTFKDYDLIIVSYNTLKKDEVDFVHDAAKFNYVVLDEAQFIKNHATKSAQVAKRLNARFRLALTGTPLENNVSEVWSVFDFLMPGFLGHYADFADRFHKPIMDKSDAKALAHLRAKITPFMLRRTKGEVLKELPPKIEQDMVAELGTAQNILYQQILAQVKSDVFLNVEQKGFKKAQIHILAGLMKLRQVCNHPALLIEKEDRAKHSYESAKLDLALELIDEAIAGGHKVLLFSQFTSMLDIIADALKARDIAHLYLSGKTRDRQSLIEKFNTDTVPLFLISLKAGGTGLNLTAADTVIIFDPWWNPSVEMQAADRAHRIGQKKTVNVYRLLTKGTIEEKIQVLKARKKSLADALVNSSGDLFTKLTWDDVRGLFV